MRKKLLFYGVTAVLMLLVLEIFAFIASHLIDRDDFFDHRAAVLPRLTDDDLAKFARSGADSELGWRSFGPRIRQENNCLGDAVEYSYDAAGARTYPGYAAEEAEIIIVGDSYTNGDEVADAASYPAKLAGLLGVSVANHGVGGYGPTQSMLNFSRNFSRYPRARVVVLAVMYENIYRMLNSYRPVLYSTSSNYSLKPFMADGVVVQHPGAHVFASLNNFLQAANFAFDSDFWAKPSLEFPYVYSLAKGFSSNYFVYRKLQKGLRSVGIPEYFLIFRSAVVEDNLVSLLNQFAMRARLAGMKPVAVFIPRNEYDIQSATAFVTAHQEAIDKHLLVGDVGQTPGVDWQRFNLREPSGDNICHPSPYGYEVIAGYIAALLQTDERLSGSQGSAFLSHR